jgi:hypothetical protein
LEAAGADVGDRALCAFASMALLVMRGADMVSRLNQRRKFDRSKARRNADGSWTAVWRKGPYSSKSPASKETWASLPDEAAVRIIEGVVECKGAVTSFRLFLAQRLVAGRPVGIANFRRMLSSIATDRVPERPGRREPRAVKKRPKPYPLFFPCWKCRGGF